MITGTPSNSDVGTHSVTVQVRDSAEATDTKTFNITVNNINDAVSLITIHQLIDAAFEYQLTATDIDMSVDVSETLAFENY